MRDIIRIYRMRLHKNAAAIIKVCILWGIGLLFGRYCAISPTNSSVFLLRTAAVSQSALLLNIANLLIIVTITFVIAQKFNGRLIESVIAGKAICTGFSIALCKEAFFSAGWLVYRILFFTQSVSTVILLFLWINVAGNSRYLTSRRYFLYLGIFCTIALIDYFLCGDFLRMIIT